MNDAQPQEPERAGMISHGDYSHAAPRNPAWCVPCLRDENAYLRTRLEAAGAVVEAARRTRVSQDAVSAELTEGGLVRAIAAYDAALSPDTPTPLSPPR